MTFAAGSLGVVELPCPARAAQAAERPLLDGVAEPAVAGHAGGDHELALARSPRDGGLAGVALQGVGRGEDLGALTDLAGDPRGEPIGDAGKAQVDVPAPKGRLLSVTLGGAAFAALARRANQQLSHTAFPGPALRIQQKELRRRQPDRVDFGTDQVGGRFEVVHRQGIKNLVGEAFGLAVVASPCERHQLLPRHRGQLSRGRPPLQHSQHRRGSEVEVGEVQRGREHCKQIGARWKSSAQSIPTPSTPTPLPVKLDGRRRSPGLMDQSSQDNTLVGVGPPGPPVGDAVSLQSSRDAIHKRSPTGTPDTEGRAIRFTITPLGAAGRALGRIVDAIVRGPATPSTAKPSPPPRRPH
jgi:hypothetical protein